MHVTTITHSMGMSSLNIVNWTWAGQGITVCPACYMYWQGANALTGSKCIDREQMYWQGANVLTGSKCIDREQMYWQGANVLKESKCIDRKQISFQELMSLKTNASHKTRRPSPQRRATRVHWVTFAHIQNFSPHAQFLFWVDIYNKITWSSKKKETLIVKETMIVKETLIVKTRRG